MSPQATTAPDPAVEYRLAQQATEKAIQALQEHTEPVQVLRETGERIGEVCGTCMVDERECLTYRRLAGPVIELYQREWQAYLRLQAARQAAQPRRRRSA